MSYSSGAHAYEQDQGWGKLPGGYELGQVADVAVDPDDRVYLFNRGSHQLIVLDREGGFVKAWGEHFSNPHGIHIDAAGEVYLVDRDAHVLLKYNADERLLLTMGTRDRPSDTGYNPEDRVVKRAADPFNLPAGVVTNEGGEIFVADGYGNSRVHKYGPDGALIYSWGEPGSANPVEFNLPHGVVLDNEGRLLVCDRENNRIQIFDQEGEFRAMWTGLRQPADAVVGPDGTVFVAELQGRVSVLTSDGDVLARWGGEGSNAPSLFGAPHGIAMDSRGDVYVAEVVQGGRIQKFVKQS